MSGLAARSYFVVREYSKLASAAVWINNNDDYHRGDESPCIQAL